MTVMLGDCIDVMATMPEASVDAIVADPPYGLGFMGHQWDQPGEYSAIRVGPGHSAGHPRERAARRRGEGPSVTSMEAGRYDLSTTAMRRYQGWCEAWAIEAFRVAKPGAYLLSFGGTRTVHRLTCGLEDAGWLIRDTLVWAYAQGFPKSRALLKPAWEPIVMARKPGPLRMLDIEGCRIEGPRTDTRKRINLGLPGGHYGSGPNHTETIGHTADGRWPANVILTDPIFDGDVAGVVGGGQAVGKGTNHVLRRGATTGAGLGYGSSSPKHVADVGYGDTGTYSRFFLIPKASRSDREPTVPHDLPERVIGVWGGDEDDLTPGKKSTLPRRNTHPTVKPVALMRHLVRLVTPRGGTVMDPFLGSGTTAIAATMEGFAWIGIEREPGHVAIAEARLQGVQRGLALGEAIA